MKYRFPLLILLAAVTAASCKKSDADPGTPDPVTARYWKVGGTTYKANSYTQSGQEYTAYDTSGNLIGFSFASYPPAAGNYQVVSDTATLGAGQVKFYVASFGTSANTYRGTGNDGVSATVSLVNGKIRIGLPDAWAKRDKDSVRVSAVLDPFL